MSKKLSSEEKRSIYKDHLKLLRNRSCVIASYSDTYQIVLYHDRFQIDYFASTGTYMVRDNNKQSGSGIENLLKYLDELDSASRERYLNMEKRVMDLVEKNKGRERLFVRVEAKEPKGFLSSLAFNYLKKLGYTIYEKGGY